MPNCTGSPYTTTAVSRVRYDLFDGCGIEQVQACAVDVSLHAGCHEGDLGFHELPGHRSTK